MTIDEIRAVFDNLGQFVLVVSEHSQDISGRRDSIYDGSGDGDAAFRIWPNQFKDINFDITSAEVTPEGGVKAETPRGTILIRTIPDMSTTG